MTALDLLSGMRLEDGRRWGEAATAWQRADAEAMLDIDGGPRRHFWTRPRGASKTTDAAGCAVAALLSRLPRAARAYVVAADREQAALMLDSIGGFRDRTPSLRGALDVQSWKVTATRSGATLEVIAADAASAWGLRPHLIIVSEFAAWPETPGTLRLWRAMYSALPKVRDSRLLIETNAGEPSHFSHAVLSDALANPASWRVSEVPGPCPWLDPDDLAEQARVLPSWEYERLHLNRWVEAEDRLVQASDLAACVVLDGPQEHTRGRTYCMSLDVGLKNDRTVLAVCSIANGPPMRLDRMLVWQGTRANPVTLDAVEAAIVEAWSHYGRPVLVADPWQSAQLCQRLRARGVRVVEYTFSSASVSRLAVRLHTAIRDRALQLPDDDLLLGELAHVRLREASPGVYRLDHDRGRHDDRAIALALAAERLLLIAVHRPARSYVPRGSIPASNASMSGRRRLASDDDLVRSIQFGGQL